MKILFIITGLGLGGAERQVCNLADQLYACGHEVALVALTGKVIVSPVNVNITIHNLDTQKTLLGVTKTYHKLQKLIKQYKPDVIHSHMVHANILARLIRLSTKLPRLICTAHSADEGGKLRMLAYRMTDWLADISTNVSFEAVQSFIAKGAVKPGRMIAIHNGINTGQFSFNPQDRKKKDHNWVYLVMQFCFLP